MKVKLIDGIELTVWFKKIHRTEGTRELVDTQCQLVGPNEHDTTTTWSYQNPLDTYDKITGKKIALTRCLCNSIYHPRKDKTDHSPMTRKEYEKKKVRDQIWSEFHRQLGHLIRK